MEESEKLESAAEPASYRLSSELAPYHMDVSRGTRDLPYAANIESNRKKRASSPPEEEHSHKRANLKLASDSSDVYMYHSQPSSDITSYHHNHNNSSLPPSSPTFYDHTEETVLYGDTDEDEVGEEGDGTKSKGLECNNKRILFDTHSFNESFNITRAENRIESAIEASNPKIALDGLELTQVPVAITDLNHMVCAGRFGFYTPELQLFLNHNYISALPTSLFDLTSLTVLILRGNQLTHIPTCISQLVNLTELSLGHNQISYLPGEILHLPKLRALSVLPNPFMPCPKDKQIVSKTPSNHQSRFFRERRAVQSHVQSRMDQDIHKLWYTQRLSEMCQLKLGRLTDSVLEEINAAPQVEEVLKETSNKMHTQCYSCQREMINGVGYAYEWWDQNDPVAFKIQFCSFYCYDNWHNEL